MGNGLHEQAILPFRKIQEEVLGFLKEANPSLIGLAEFADGQGQIQRFIRGLSNEGGLIGGGNAQRTESSQAENAGHLGIREHQPLSSVVKDERRGLVMKLVAWKPFLHAEVKGCLEYLAEFGNFELTAKVFGGDGHVSSVECGMDQNPRHAVK